MTKKEYIKNQLKTCRKILKEYEWEFSLRTEENTDHLFYESSIDHKKEQIALYEQALKELK